MDKVRLVFCLFIFRAVKFEKWLLLMLLLLQISPISAQRLNINFSSFEEYYRRKQLLGEVDSTVSFLLRPLELSELNGGTASDSSVMNYLFRSMDKKKRIGVMPVHLYQQYNRNALQSWNNGPLIASRGYQTMVSAGAFARIGPLTIQLRPEMIFAENKRNNGHKLVYGLADLPVRSGGNHYSNLTWGQSSISVKFDPVSVKLSNENMWSGPGIRNSLLMSNNAQGFKHLSLNTSRPIKTAIGSIEAQILAGKLEGSGIDSSLPDDWRYLSGFVFSYQPKWVSGLFLGMTRSFQMYNNDMDDSFGDIFPIFQAFQKVNTEEDSKPRDQLTSIFARLLVPKANSEVYFEYGLADHSYNIRDFLMSPEHSRAYILGMKKLIPFKSRDSEHIEFSAEITRMEQSIDRSIRFAGEWYTHSQVVHGYTHRGEVLGAGIGPSGNLQSIGINWVKDLKKIGIQLERLEYNGDLAARADYSPWIDFNLSTVADWTFNKFLISGKLQGIQSVNYQWQDGISSRPKQNIFNINAHLGIMYSF